MTAPVKWYNQRRLRLTAGAALAVAMTMLGLGLTVMEPYLDVKSAGFWVWWGVVLLLVMTAFVMAVLDVADLRRQLTAERKELLKTHFDRDFLKELEAKVGEQRQKKEDGEDRDGGRQANR